MMNRKRIIVVVLLLAGVGLAATGCGPGRYYNKGVEKYNVRDYDGALTEFNKALAKDKNNEFPDTKDWIVKCYMERGEKSRETNIYAALSDFERAVDEGRRLGASQSLVDEAERLHEDAVVERDRRARESKRLQEKAEAAMAGRDYDQAEQLLAEAMRVDPRNRGAAGLMNKVREIKRKIEESKRLVAEGDALLNAAGVTLRDAERAKSNYERAKDAYEFNVDADAGIARAEAIIADIKRDAEAKYRAGLKHFEAREWSDCVEALEECVRLDYTRGDANAKLREARAMYSAQRSYEAYVDRARAKLAGAAPTVDGADEAINLCDRAIEAYPYNDEAKALREKAAAQREECLKRAEERYKSGVAAMEAGDWKTAEKEFSACLAIHPGHTEARADLAEVRVKIERAEKVAKLLAEGEEYLRREKPREAKNAFQDALRLDPGNPEATDGAKRANEMINRIKEEARTFYESALRKIKAHDYKGALADLDKAVEKDPYTPLYERKRDEVKKLIEQAQDAEDLIAEGEKSLKEDKPYLAKKAFQDALKVDPGNPEAIDGVKRADEMINRIKEEARAHYEAALKKIKAKDYDGALGELDKAIEKDPYTPLYERKRDEVKKLQAGEHYAKGKQYEKEEKWVLAQKEYEKAAEYDKRYEIDVLRMKNESEAEGMIQVGNMHMSKKRYMDAAMSYKDALPLTSRKRMVEDKIEAALDKLKVEADAEWQAGNYEEALAQLKAIQQVNPHYDNLKQLVPEYDRRLKTADRNYGEALKKREALELSAAKALLEKVLADLPRYKDAATILGEINDDLKDAKRHYDRGRDYEKNKKYELAIARYEEALTLVKDYEDAATRIKDLKKAAEEYAGGETLLGEKKLEEALKAFKAVEKIRSDYADVKDKIKKIEDDLHEVKWLYDRGRKYQGEKEWQKAVGMYEAVLDLIHDYKDVKGRLAECRRQLEK